MFKKLSIISVCTLMAISLFVSCNDSTSSMNGAPPDVPPSQSMDMDFSTFSNQNQQKSAVEPQITADSTGSFQQAYARAIIMKLVVDANLAVPRALLQAASNSNAELNEDQEWVWKYSQQADSSSYAVRLVASSQQNSQVKWQFFVTNTQQGLDDQLFFEGMTNESGTEGTWTYFNLRNTDSEEPVSTIDWTADGESDVHLTLEVLSDRNDHTGDTIEYTFDGTAKTAIYYNAADDESTEIQWNVNTHAGYLVAPEFNDGQKSCWDSNLSDVSCEEI